MTIAKGLYKHYKGNFYKVIDVATHSETQESLVVYQALYGEKGIWVRPLSMFTETIEKDNKTVARFQYIANQTEVLELAILNVKPEQEKEFEVAFEEAQAIISNMDGYISHRLEKCIEKNNQYVLLAQWQTLESHTIGFRQSLQYKRWSELLHGFYEPFPNVEHYRNIL